MGLRKEVQTEAIRRLQRKTNQYRTIRDEWETEIATLYRDEILSLRAVAEIAGVSHEQVRRIANGTVADARTAEE